MAAVAREFSPPRPAARLVPPRPSPKSVPPPLPPAQTQATDSDSEEVMDVSDTAVHELVIEDLAPLMKKPENAAPIERDTKPVHPGMMLLRTLGFFVSHMTMDVVRSVRAYVAAHWVRARARATANR